MLVVIGGVRWQLGTAGAARDRRTWYVFDVVYLAALGGWDSALDGQLGMGVVDWRRGTAGVVWDRRIWYGVDSRDACVYFCIDWDDWLGIVYVMGNRCWV